MGVHPAPRSPVGFEWVDCHTPLGNAAATARALTAETVALELTPVLSVGAADPVPLALFSPLAERFPPRGWDVVQAFLGRLPAAPWGTAAFPVIVASSNFGVGSLLEFSRDQAPGHLPFATPHGSVARLAAEAGWGRDVMTVSHACVSAQLALFEAERRLREETVEQVLVFAYDLLSDFVTGGFHALKILNGLEPAPFMEGDEGAIGLGDGIAAAVVSRNPRAPWQMAATSTWNELYHMTSNEPAGTGFAAVMDPLAHRVKGRRVWLKGHGTGTLDAGRLEVAAAQRAFGDAPLISWKGSLGHTLGSSALVELAVALAAMEAGTIPGTVHRSSGRQPMGSQVATAAFGADGFDGFILFSNAFGGAHAGAWIHHA